MEDQIKYFYFFRGTWLGRMEEVLEVITDGRPFEIWEPLDKTKALHVLIVYDSPLPSLYCMGNHIWATTKEIVSQFYRNKLGEFNIHRYQFKDYPPYHRVVGF